MRFIQIVVATFIIVAIIVAFAADWVTFVAIVALAALAGLVTRLVIPRDLRFKAFERLNPSGARRIRDESARRASPADVHDGYDQDDER